MFFGPCFVVGLGTGVKNWQHSWTGCVMVWGAVSELHLGVGWCDLIKRHRNLNHLELLLFQKLELLSWFRSLSSILLLTCDGYTSNKCFLSSAKFILSPDNKETKKREA
ncbi:hypothetical protein BpHYR1_050583 [Brachionus plicatilis]|uniref:Uncharacterized protein n=1 Tax=Brachionus plicatilis TaxID=10195 RepID=A0A3M7S3S5_BRAPC|nr:hypothetical protein BpHYR1_050583 [Brachionus plicatilis]